MRKSLLLFLVVILASFKADFNPQTKEITNKFFPEVVLDIPTPAFQKKKGFTNHAEMMVFIDSLQAKYPSIVTVKFIGESQQGKKVPFVVFSKNSPQPKKRFWFQGGLHGDEMATTECVLYLMHQLLSTPSFDHLLDKFDIGFIPMANVDGYERQNRYAANGLDLNRDQTKLMVKESVFLKETFSQFNPHVAIDIHEYNPYRKDFSQLGTYGVTSLYDVMFMTSGNLNVPEKLRNTTNSLFVANAYKALDKLNLTYREYVTTDKDLGEMHWNQGSNNARSSATSYALANTISTLIEIRGVGIDRTSFKRRILSGFTIAMAYLETAAMYPEVVNEALTLENHLGKEVIVTSSKEKLVQPIKFIDLATLDVVDISCNTLNASNSKPVLVRSYPKAYLISASELEAVNKLKVLGLTIEPLKNDTQMNVQSYQVSSCKKSNEKEEGVFTQKVETINREGLVEFKKGDFLLMMNQENAPLAAEVLEPEAPNSFVRNSIIAAPVNNLLPIYRLIK